MSYFIALTTVITGALVLPVVVLWLQVVGALISGRFSIGQRANDRSNEPESPRPRIAVLVPAHNEARGITQALVSVRQQLSRDDRLLVIADNCTDDTANVARAAGADVIERQDATRRGKGYALDFGLRHLERTPPDVLVMMDADCCLHAGSLGTLTRACHRFQRPIQAVYLMEPLSHAGLSQRIAQFAWRVKNLSRPLGWSRLGGPCQLMGTGMAFPWALIAQAKLASGNIVEDMQLGIDLGLAGHPPKFEPSALVSSYFPDTQEASRAQRKRWEHGHLHTLLRGGPRLLLKGLLHARWALIAQAADLMVPPLALLLMLHLSLAGINTVALGLLSGVWLPALVSACALLLLACAVLLAWCHSGRDIVSLAELAMAPIYAIRKLPMYATFLFRRQAEWVRAKRDGE
jgi:cellulose synthase/poly-beta-1,6-N-acetylglucosamine synthase-like glycosyltransferase